MRNIFAFFWLIISCAIFMLITCYALVYCVKYLICMRRVQEKTNEKEEAKEIEENRKKMHLERVISGAIEPRFVVEADGTRRLVYDIENRADQ